MVKFKIKMDISPPWDGLSPMEKVSVDAGKALEDFRVYDTSSEARVVNHYRDMRTNQTLEFVNMMHEKYHKFNHERMSIKEMFIALEGYIDSSDPDTDIPNIVHAFQTAEEIRKKGYPDWFQLTGLIHDLGKVMFILGDQSVKEAEGQCGTVDGAQWALGGDTWVVGCQIPDCVVFPEFNELNADASNPKLNTKLGIYSKRCGLEKLKFAYGHDEYLYQMLKFNNCKLPEEAMAMIRYHSCYPWHTGNAYEHFETDNDKRLKKWVIDFNQFDLYTKADVVPDIDNLWPYYQSLIDKYCPGKLFL